MADEDKEKAEKLAAAKKRFEQLKKEKNAKAKKGGKKKSDKTEESKTDAANEGAEEADPATEEQETEEKADKDGETGASKPDPHSEVQELYRKQASKIEDLEKENKALKEQQEEGASKLAKAEEELDSLREGSSDLASLRSKAKDVDRLTTELAAAQRQLQQQSSKPASTRRQSTVTPDISKELASKTSTIESLELEISNLRNQLTTLETTHSTSTAELTDRASTAEAATASTKQELDALKVSLSFPSDKEDPEALAKRISVLESDLRTANTSLEAAAQKATSLESKIQTLTKLHKDATTTSQQKDKELMDLRSQLKRRDRPSHVHPTDTSDFELGEEETETGALHAKIRALEAENFDLKRGVWRDRRASLQPGMDDGGPGYEDVDLTPGPYSPGSGRGSLGRQTSTFQDVITSGISAFTGRPREMPQRPAAARERAESMGLLDDDDGFDEEAFRLAQEEEAKRRIERIKEVKRGLDQWKGWRVDLVDSRQNGLGPGRDVGPIFEV